MAPAGEGPARPRCRSRPARIGAAPAGAAGAPGAAGRLLPPAAREQMRCDRGSRGCRGSRGSMCWMCNGARDLPPELTRSALAAAAPLRILLFPSLGRQGGERPLPPRPWMPWSVRLDYSTWQAHGFGLLLPRKRAGAASRERPGRSRGLCCALWCLLGSEFLKSCSPRGPARWEGRV